MEELSVKYVGGCPAANDGNDVQIPCRCTADSVATSHEENFASAAEAAEEPLLGTATHSRSTWLQTTAALLALQLGWGLWLIPQVFATLGWYTAAGSLLALVVLTVYSGSLFSRLFLCTPVLFGDIGYAAAGSFGRNTVYAVVYSTDATRCVILHLAASQSLQHVFNQNSMPHLWQCGLVVLVVAAALVQVRSLAQLTWVFAAGTASQMVAIAFVLAELINNPDPGAKRSTQAVTCDSLDSASVALMNMIFAFGGQFAFIEIISSMRRPQEFPKAMTACTILMALLYGLVGVVGYWSRGDAIDGIIIFSLGGSVRIQLASACILVQATSQYLVNLNVWTHNLLVLLYRYSKGQPAAEIRCSGDHCRWRWLAASIFVVTYSFIISTSVPYFGTLVGLVTSSTYLLCAYALPAWFTLRLLWDRLGVIETSVLWLLIPLAVAFSGVGLYGSIKALVDDISGGEGGGWS